MLKIGYDDYSVKMDSISRVGARHSDPGFESYMSNNLENERKYNPSEMDKTAEVVKPASMDDKSDYSSNTNQFNEEAIEHEKRNNNESQEIDIAGILSQDKSVLGEYASTLNRERTDRSGIADRTENNTINKTKKNIGALNKIFSGSNELSNELSNEQNIGVQLKQAGKSSTVEVSMNDGGKVVLKDAVKDVGGDSLLKRVLKKDMTGQGLESNTGGLINLGSMINNNLEKAAQSDDAKSGPKARIKLGAGDLTTKRGEHGIKISLDAEKATKTSSIFEGIKSLNKFIKSGEESALSPEGGAVGSVKEASGGKKSLRIADLLQSKISEKTEGEKLSGLTNTDTREMSKVNTDFSFDRTKIDGEIRADRSSLRAEADQMRSRTFDEIVNNTKIAMTAGETKFSSMMRPEQLGRIDFSFTVKDGKFNGKVILQNQEAADFFRANIEDLKAVFQKSNVEFGNIDIILAGSNMGQSSGFKEQSDKAFNEDDKLKSKKVSEASDRFESNVISSLESNSYNGYKTGINVVV